MANTVCTRRELHKGSKVRDAGGTLKFEKKGGCWIPANAPTNKEGGVASAFSLRKLRHMVEEYGWVVS